MKNFTQFFKSFFTLVVILLLGGGNVWGEIAWLPETINGGSAYYIQHKNTGKWLNANNNTLQNTPNATWTPSGSNPYTFASSNVGNKSYRWRIYENWGDKCTTTDQSGATNNNCALQSDGSYDVYVTRSSGGTWYLHATVNNSNVLSVSSEKNVNNPKDYWLFFGVPQYNNHFALVDYEVANNALSAYNGSNLPNALWNQIKDAVNSATNYLSYSEWIKTTDKSGEIISTKNTLTTFTSTYGSTLPEVSVAYLSALANIFTEVEHALSTAEEGDAKTALQDAYNTARTNLEAATSVSEIASVVSVLSDALTEFYKSNKPQPAFNKNYEDAAANMLVSGTIANAFNIQNAPSYTISYKDNGASDASATSAVITFDGGTITAIGAGSVVLILDQTETAEVKAGHAEFAFSVNKHDVVWAWNAGGAAYLYNTTINNILTLTEGNPSNISIVSDNELVAKVENGNLVIGKVAGSAHISVTAAEDNKWNAKEETFTVTPGHVANHVPLNYGQALFEDNNVTTKDAKLDAVDNYTNFKVSGTKSQEHYLQIAFEGIPNKLSFHYKPVTTGGISNWEGNNYYVRESADGVNWSDNIWSADGGSSNTYVDVNVTLKRTTRFVRFIYKGHESGGYFGNINISESKALSAETPEAIETTLGDTESVSTNIVLTYANAGITINASVAGEGFSINKTSVEGGIDVYGEETFVVSFDPTGKAAGEHSATVTFTDGTLQKEVVVTAHVLVPLSLVAMNNENGTDYYYATFSNADYAVEFGNDVEVYTVSVDGDRMNLNPVSSHQVPANAGVLIKSQSNNILYKYISSAADLSNNMLKPGTGGMTEGDNCRFYRLAYYDYAAKTGLGFYYGSGCKDGEAFMCKAGTAYLAVPRTVAAPARFLLGRQDVSTEIENMIIDNTSTNSNHADGKKVMVNGVLYIVRDGKTYDSFGRMVK